MAMFSMGVYMGGANTFPLCFFASLHSFLPHAPQRQPTAATVMPNALASCFRADLASKGQTAHGGLTPHRGH
ncbi:hypothetical protein BZA05DRAFT_393047 [Tricharina praecox]|uniref:uncharacterized protein n=1 Tax=Tricharina praecox TaxID=43433 RepID=UPI00221E8553|nr:uncharacterized protein BZA05DRAFT_393047 [Tricharina praecox]KAI5854948.1 hypothetical protein BZA05DRAFT_393047 [Tricharina praecox]